MPLKILSWLLNNDNSFIRQNFVNTSCLESFFGQHPLWSFFFYLLIHTVAAVSRVRRPCVKNAIDGTSDGTMFIDIFNSNEKL